MSGLVVRQDDKIEEARPPSSLLELIAAAVADPRCDVEKMERLLAMQERVEADRRKQVFFAALSLAQAEIPQIEKHGRVIVKGVLRSKYAKLEDIDAVIRPICAKYGFAFSDDTEAIDAKTIKVICRLSHSEGHFDIKSLPVPIDFSDYRTGSQSVVASVTLAKRNLRKMHLNITDRDEDTDGEALVFLTPDQARELEALGQEVKANWPEFLKWMNVAKTTEIAVRDLQKAITGLEAKRRSK